MRAIEHNVVGVYQAIGALLKGVGALLLILVMAMAAHYHGWAGSAEGVSVSPASSAAD